MFTTVKARWGRALIIYELYILTVCNTINIHYWKLYKAAFVVYIDANEIEGYKINI